MPWSAELARYTMVWSALLAAAALVRRQGHLMVDVITCYLSPRQNRLLSTLLGVAALVFFLILFVSGLALVAGTVGQVASSMPALPMSFVYSIVPSSALLMVANTCLVFWEDLSQESSS